MNWEGAWKKMSVAGPLVLTINPEFVFASPRVFRLTVTNENRVEVFDMLFPTMEMAQQTGERIARVLLKARRDKLDPVDTAQALASAVVDMEQEWVR